MRANLLSRPTPSGDYEEVKFEASGNCNWVLFQPGDSEDWVGVFGRGELGRDAVAISQTGRTICVLAGGSAYLVDASERRLLHKSAHEQLQSVVSVPGQELFIAADFIRLYAYDRSGVKWPSARVSLDGINLGAADASGIGGEVWTIERWVPFRLEFDQWRYSCSWLCPY